MSMLLAALPALPLPRAERAVDNAFAKIRSELLHDSAKNEGAGTPIVAAHRTADRPELIASLGAPQSYVATRKLVPGSLRDADADGRLTSVDISSIGSGRGSFRSPAQIAASLVATGARKFVFGENHYTPHPELVVATILDIVRRSGERPVVFHESFAGPFQDLIEDLQRGVLTERQFARSYVGLADDLSGGSATEYARKIFVPQLLAYHRAGARIVPLDDLQESKNHDAAWEARYVSDQAANPHEFSIFVVGGVHSQKSPSISDKNFPENDFARPLGMRIAERYGPAGTLNIYVANTPSDGMADLYKPAFGSWDAILPMPKALSGSGSLLMALPADEDGVPLLSPEALGAEWQTPSLRQKDVSIGKPSIGKPSSGGDGASLNVSPLHQVMERLP